MTTIRSLSIGIAVACGAALASSSAGADPIADFYAGKTINLYIAFPPGGGYDIYTRLVTRFMTTHIPGKPLIVPKNMPGGGSRVAAGYVYNIAPKDGTTLATVSQSLPLEQAMDPDPKFDISRFIWIGNPVVDNNVAVTWHASGIATIDDAKQREVVVGSTGADASSQYPKVMNAVLGTKFKIVSGYPGTNEMNLAMERGETMGRGSSSWASWRATKPDWLRDKKINILVQIGLKKNDELPDVPLLMDLATNEADRTLLRLISAPIPIGRPLLTTPDVPDERVKMLRGAFDVTMKDADFLNEAQKARFDIAPLSGVELQKIVTDIAQTPDRQTARLVEILK